MDLKALLELTRPTTVLLAAAAVILAIIVGKGDIFYISLAIPAIVAVSCITAAGNVINDYCDVKIDKINQPSRPLPSGRVSLESAKFFAFLLFTVGIFFSLFLPLLCIIIAVANSFLLVIYAMFFKKSGFLGNLIVSCMIASLFVFGAAPTGQIIIGVFLAIMAFFASAVREVLKDMEDVLGDKLGGAKTLPTGRGKKKTEAIVISLLLLAIMFSPVPYLTEVFSLYYIFVVVIADLFFARVIISVLNSSKVKARTNVRFVNIALNIALLAFFAGLIPW